MTKNKTLSLIAFILVILPFVGFTRLWEDVLTVFFGLAIALVTFVGVRQNRIGHMTERTVVEKEDVYYDEGYGVTGSTVEVTEHLVFEDDSKTE